MNNKGFAITGFIYTIFIIFIGLMIAILSLFSSRKNILDNLKKDVSDIVNRTNSINNYDHKITETNVINEYVIPISGYYYITIKSPKIGDINGSTITFEVYLLRGESYYVLIGTNNYNNGAVEIRTSKNDSNSAIVRASYKADQNKVVDEYDGRILSNVQIINNNVTDTNGSVFPEYESRIKRNDSFNRVQYVKNCISGNSENEENAWSEIQVIVNGVNIAKGKNIIYTSEAKNTNPYSNIVDGSMDTYALSSEEGNQCVTVDLERTYNVDTITISHKPNKYYYENKTYLSGDGQNYNLISSLDEKEDEKGQTLTSYEYTNLILVGGVYVPYKRFDDAMWIRLFHHNNKGGTVLWDSLAQTYVQEGYDDNYKQSILFMAANLENYKIDGKYEFMLEYSDLEGYNRWTQTSNPGEKTGEVTGYKAIHISWSDGFKGLSLSETGKTLLNGSADSKDYYPIGVINHNNDIDDENEEDEEDGGIMINSDYMTQGSTDLWLRVEPENNE